jgi:hypothetical protein
MKLMRSRTAWTTGLLLISLAAASGRPGRATEPRANDGGLNELVIYLSSDHPRGVPNVEFRQIETDLRRMRIEIPPAVHVHRYYYNGNKEFQGPLVVGGPTVIVANHPKTNERLYIEAQLPAGAPVISYNRDSITYVFQEKRVEISFSAHHTEKYRVSYQGTRGIRTLHERGRALADRREERRETSQFRRSFTTANQGLRDMSRGLAAGAGDVVARGGQAVGQAFTLVPGVRALQDRGRQVESDRATLRFRSAVERNRVDDLQYEPTVR